MAMAKMGDTVRLIYTCRLEDGTFIDSSAGEHAEEADPAAPMELELGSDYCLPGLEQAVVGMSVGENKEAVVAAVDAYGEHYPDMITSVAPEELPAEIEPEIGMILEAYDEEGNSFPVTIIAIEEDRIRFDANHPLAGEDLHYAIELKEIL